MPFHIPRKRKGLKCKKHFFSLPPAAPPLQKSGNHTIVGEDRILSDGGYLFPKTLCEQRGYPPFPASVGGRGNPAPTVFPKLARTMRYPRHWQKPFSAHFHLFLVGDTSPVPHIKTAFCQCKRLLQKLPCKQPLLVLQYFHHALGEEKINETWYRGSSQRGKKHPF